MNKKEEEEERTAYHRYQHGQRHLLRIFGWALCSGFAVTQTLELC